MIVGEHYHEHIFVEPLYFFAALLFDLLLTLVLLVLIDYYLLQLQTQVLFFRILDDFLNEVTLSSVHFKLLRQSLELKLDLTLLFLRAFLAI